MYTTIISYFSDFLEGNGQVDEMHMVKIRDHERSESQSSTNAVPDVVNDQEVNIESGDQDANLRRTIRRQQVEDLQVSLLIAGNRPATTH